MLITFMEDNHSGTSLTVDLSRSSTVGEQDYTLVVNVCSQLQLLVGEVVTRWEYPAAV